MDTNRIGGNPMEKKGFRRGEKGLFSLDLEPSVEKSGGGRKKKGLVSM